MRLKNRVLRQSLHALLGTALLAIATAAAGQDWPQLLGPDRSGVADGAGLASEFPDGKPKVAWQANVGLGSAPVVVAGGRVYAFGLFRPGTKSTDIAATSTRSASMPPQASKCGRPG